MVVAYLMTVTHYSWDECLSAVKAVRSFVGPNYGFQQQLQEYQATQVSEVNARALHTHTHSHKAFDFQTTVTTFKFSRALLVTLAQHLLECMMRSINTSGTTHTQILHSAASYESFGDMLKLALAS